MFVEVHSQTKCFLVLAHTPVFNFLVAILIKYFHYKKMQLLSNCTKTCFNTMTFYFISFYKEIKIEHCLIAVKN